MIKGIHHTAISTANLERLSQFYSEVLGFEKIMEGSWDRGSEVYDQIVGLKDSAAKQTMLQKGGAIIELFEYSSPPPEPKNPDWKVCDYGYTHICLEVEDIEFEMERLKQAGMTFHASPPKGLSGIRAIYGRDPEGNVIELLETGDDSAIA